MGHTILSLVAIVYGVSFIPALRTAIAFWLHKEDDLIAYGAMRHGFIWGFLKIWIIYPIYIIKDCINTLKDYGKQKGENM